MYFLVLGTDKPGMADVRSEVRPIHRAYLRNPGAHPVKVHFGGPTLTTQGEQANGTLLVVDYQRDGDEWKVAYDFVLEPAA